MFYFSMTTVASPGNAPTPVKAATEGSHRGYGKVILFGEHVVVYGAPAVVAGVAEYTTCELKVLPGKPGWEVVDRRPAVPGYIVEKAHEQKLAHKLVLDHLKIDTTVNGLQITLAGPLVPTSGIGASASDVVALSRALNELYDLRLNEHQINHSAWVGEGGYHGNPSGVDNTAATFGGLLTYQRDLQTKKAQFNRLPCASRLHVIVIGTGMTSSTTKVLSDVRELSVKQPAAFGATMKRYASIYNRAQRAIKEGDLQGLGRLMYECHEVCQALTVSCRELDAIVAACRRLGAIGAKMSGTGRGGIAVALAADQQQQRYIAAELAKSCREAKFVWQYSIAPQTESKL